jgi:Uma2 family endonuclease
MSAKRATARTTQTKNRLVTFEEFCFRVNEDQKADLIDGVIYMASPENTDANDLFMWLSGLLHLFVQKRKAGKVYGSRVAFRLGEHQSPEPDIAFVAKERLHLVQRGYIDGPPDLAIEIVSPDSVERDYQTKKEQYEKAGVREYWIVDEIMQEVTLYRLNAQGSFSKVKPRKGVLTSKVLPGFWLRTDWLWQTPLPDTLETLAQLLGE